MRRATVADVEDVNDWVYRDNAKRTDFYQFLADDMTVCLIEGQGGALFVWRGPGIFETHLFLEQRGKAAFALLERMFARLKAKHGAKLLWAAVPIESRHVIMTARILGWQSQGVEQLSHGPCELFTLEFN